ncbi:DEAD/DEAH box helicase family protein, partial [bacterium]|nr:DEAD/DEAH box helicase family protein [bacterium]
MKYALALVNIKGLGVKTFSYLIPDEMKDKIQIGQAILVPFGRQGLINAFCVGFSDYLPEEIKAKKINKILDETPLFSIEYLKLLEWVANYYCCDLVTVLNAAIPMKLIEKASKTEQLIEFVKFDGATKRQIEVLELLEKSGKMPLVLFEKYAKTTRATIKKLESIGCVKLIQEELYRNPLDILRITEREPLFELSGEQKEVYEGIKNKINSKNTILLHGVTASGKTEVYFKLIDDTIKQGKNVLFLAPEIALASQLTKRLAKKFGTEDVAIWHSSISDGERYDVWQKLYKNEIKILAGARSAVFAPLQNIGLIIIDEEHESAYKQTTPAPRYDARLVARKLSEFHNCPLILGSATPDISSYYRAVNEGNLFELKHRYN